MIDHRAASRYARALLELAVDGNNLEGVEKDLIKVRELLGNHPEITHLVLNSTIPISEKEDFLEKILGDGILPLTANFLKLLVKKGRFQEFAFIQADFHRRYEKRKGIQEVLVLSRQELPEPARTQLAAALTKKLRTEIRLKCKTDDGMIGGLIIRFGDREIDSSYRTRLAELKQRLL